ncbi:hypothetical protein GBA52_010753 [Prunus armeniaca]|nr:hypothetical protein GBA52_010753 [Prunus armeniaca]
MAPMLKFTVQVSKPELIRPEKPTPREFKYLSNIDDQKGLRNHIPFVHFYPPSTVSSHTHDQDPVGLIKQALARALVYYYPMAGRLRHAIRASSLWTVVLREADGGLKPPFPQWESLLVDDLWGSVLITDSPLLRMQVTRLACGGFVLAYTLNHCICDAYGACILIKAISEFCLNPTQVAPSLLSAWGRQALHPRSPPTISFPHHEYDVTSSSPHDPEDPTAAYNETDFKSLAQTSVFLSQADISSLKNQTYSQKSPAFHAIAGCELVDSPLQYASNLISQVKKVVTENEYRASMLDFIEMNRRRELVADGGFAVSDMSKLRFVDLDFGWGKGVYGGPGRAGTGLVPGMVTSVIGHKNEEGVEGVLALVSLPAEYVGKFRKEVRKEIDCGNSYAKHISAL